MGRIIVIDCTGPNKRCNACREVVGDAAIFAVNQWWCDSCLKAHKKEEKYRDAHSVQVSRKVKKRGRTLKSYIVECLQAGDVLVVADVAQKALDNALTKASDLKVAKISVSSTISQLRKDGYPIERVRCGTYKWRTS